MSIANIFMHKIANWMKRRNLETCINSLIQFDTFKLIFYLHLITVIRIIYGQNVYAAYKIAPKEMLKNNIKRGLEK